MSNQVPTGGKRKTATAKREDPIRQRREQQLQQVLELIPILQEGTEHYQEAKDQQGLLESVSLGMYDEIDKLVKKAPAEQVTELVLEQVNDVIRGTKQLVQEDAYVQKLMEFVPAGDLPELRDVLFVIRQVRQGLERFGQIVTDREHTASRLLEEAMAVKAAIECYLEGVSSVSEDALGAKGASAPSTWMGSYPHYFDFKRLDRTNIQEYFRVP